jgi:hypothetical protein
VIGTEEGHRPIPTVWEFTDTWEQVDVSSEREISQLIRAPGRRVWVDLDTDEDSASGFLKGLRQECGELLSQLDPGRAGLGGDNPPRNPPKAKTFHNFVFGRIYWLKHMAAERSVGGRDVGEEGRRNVVAAQEIHLIAGRTFAITIRYGVLGWHLDEMLSDEDRSLRRVSDPGMDMEQLRDEVGRFIQDTNQPESNFGLKFAAGLLDQVIDSVFDALDGLRRMADDLESRVLRKEEWLWKPKKWPELDSKMLGLRRFLRQVRWAFMPPDEIDEFRAGPFLENTESDPVVDFRYRDLDREAERALASVNDVAAQADRVVALRDTLKTDRLNNTMYVLTAVATMLLIPTVIAGIYGMNFLHMPELRWRFGYLGALVAMVLLGSAVWLLIRSRLQQTGGGGRGRRPGGGGSG